MSVAYFWCHTEGCPNWGISRPRLAGSGWKCELCKNTMLLRAPNELPAIVLDTPILKEEQTEALVKKFAKWLVAQGPTRFDEIAARNPDRRIVNVLITRNEPPASLSMTEYRSTRCTRKFVKIENGEDGFFLDDLYSAIRTALKESEKLSDS